MRKISALAMLLACLLFVAACGSTDEGGTAEETQTTQTQAEEQQPSKTGENNAEFFDQEQMDTQLQQRTATPEGPEGKPWEQYIDAEMVDTA